MMKKIWKYEGIQGFFKGILLIDYFSEDGRTFKSTSPKCAQYCILIYVPTTTS